MSLQNLLHKYRNPLTSSDGHICYYNFWNKQPANEIWFTTFLRSRGFLDRHPRAHFIFFSSLGNINILSIDKLAHPFSHYRKRIYFNGENNHHPNFASYKHNLLDHNTINLSLGFDYIDDSRYLRLPLWILEMFPADSTETTIKQICEQLSLQHWYPDSRERFCALVSGNRGPDDPGVMMRTRIVESLTPISSIDCAGRLLHNTDELKTKFNDNKTEFLKQYKFYICPENASVNGYVTEKVFHAIGSGCIPIYWGACGNPEPDVLNHDAILFWDKDGDNNSLIEKVRELQNNPAKYKDFFEQPRLKPDAWQVVAHYFEQLEKKLNDMLN